MGCICCSPRVRCESQRDYKITIGMLSGSTVPARWHLASAVSARILLPPWNPLAFDGGLLQYRPASHTFGSERRVPVPFLRIFARSEEHTSELQSPVHL